MMKKGLWTRLMAAVMMLALVMSFAATPAYAAARKTVRKQAFTTSTSVAKKKATRVKRGTTKLTIKGGQGYVKFKAPKTKTYTFTMSNVRRSGYKGSAYWYIMKPYGSRKYLTISKVRTQGGRASTLWMSVNGYRASGSKVYRPLASRYGKIKLKKGQEVYLYFYGLNVKNTATLRIR